MHHVEYPTYPRTFWIVNERTKQALCVLFTAVCKRPWIQNKDRKLALGYVQHYTHTRVWTSQKAWLKSTNRLFLGPVAWPIDWCYISLVVQVEIQLLPLKH